MGRILNLFIKTGNDYSLAVNSTESSISTSVFEVYMLQVKANRRNYNFYVIIYNMIKLIMLHIYNTIKLDAIKAFVIIFDMIKLILLRIHLKRSSNE